MIGFINSGEYKDENLEQTNAWYCRPHHSSHMKKKSFYYFYSKNIKSDGVFF
jgi:hypothetical protein